MASGDREEKVAAVIAKRPFADLGGVPEGGGKVRD